MITHLITRNGREKKANHTQRPLDDIQCATLKSLNRFWRTSTKQRKLTILLSVTLKPTLCRVTDSPLGTSHLSDLLSSTCGFWANCRLLKSPQRSRNQRSTFIPHANEVLPGKVLAPTDHSSTHSLWPPIVHLSAAHCQAWPVSSAATESSLLLPCAKPSFFLPTSSNNELLIKAPGYGRVGVLGKYFH